MKTDRITILKALNNVKNCVGVIERFCLKKSTFANTSKRLLILSAKVGFDFANMSEKLKDFSE